MTPEIFIHTYRPIVKNIASEIQLINGFHNLFEPQLPGVGEEYWLSKRHPKIAFIGKDVGVSNPINNGLDDLDLYMQKASAIVSDADMLSWNRGYGTFAGAMIYLLSQIFQVAEDDLINGKRDDILTAIVWAQTNSVWNFKSWIQSKPEFDFETWHLLNKICAPLDSLKLLLNATNFDLAIIMSWDVGNYIDLSYELVKEENHLRLLAINGMNKYIIHTCHPSHWRSDYSSDPFYNRLSAILEMIKSKLAFN
jgi:hypothetical protein